MIRPRSTAHHVLQILAAGPLQPDTLRAATPGRRHAVNVAIERLAERGLLRVEARITARGRAALKKSPRGTACISPGPAP